MCKETEQNNTADIPDNNNLEDSTISPKMTEEENETAVKRKSF